MSRASRVPDDAFNADVYTVLFKVSYDLYTGGAELLGPEARQGPSGPRQDPP